MNENTLGDYLNPKDDGSLEDDKPGIEGEMFQQEANTLKIEKLSQRVTIISVIIPCIIIAILAFVYLDINREGGGCGPDPGKPRWNRCHRILKSSSMRWMCALPRPPHELDEKLTTT